MNTGKMNNGFNQKRYFESSLIITNIRVSRLFLPQVFLNGLEQVIDRDKNLQIVIIKLNKIFRYFDNIYNTFITQLLTVNCWTIKCIPFIKRILCVEGIKIFLKLGKLSESSQSIKY